MLHPFTSHSSIPLCFSQLYFSIFLVCCALLELTFPVQWPLPQFPWRHPSSSATSILPPRVAPVTPLVRHLFYTALPQYSGRPQLVRSHPHSLLLPRSPLVRPTGFPPSPIPPLSSSCLVKLRGGIFTVGVILSPLRLPISSPKSLALPSGVLPSPQGIMNS